MNLPQSTSLSLIDGVRRRDGESWTRLTRLYGPLVFAWARRHGLQHEDAADIVQIVFASVARSIAALKYDGANGSFRGWLWAITLNKVRDFCRKQAVEPPGVGGTDTIARLAQIPSQAPDPATDPQEQQQLDSLLARGLELVRGEFEPRTWTAFWQVTIEGRGTADVGAELGIAANSVRQAKSRVLRRLREIMCDVSADFSDDGQCVLKM